MSVFLRKSYRMAGIIFPLVYYFNPNRRDVLIFILIFVIPVAVIEIWRRLSAPVNRVVCKVLAPIGRAYEEKGISGTSYFLLAILLTALLFERSIAILSMLFLIFGDAVSALFGMKFGRIKIGERTLEGSLSFFIVCLLIGFVLIPANLDVSLLSVAMGALAATLVELIPVRINDNLTIALAAGAVMTVLKCLG
jgi:glycerol-3-phosphate acyltransferase PlsY